MSKKLSKEYLDMINHPIALAYWFMDDGTSIGTIATNSFKEEEHNVIITWLQEKWNILATKQKNADNYVLHISDKSRKEFDNLIRPYVIDSMLYKLKH